MRTIKELLQLMLDNKQLFEDGLCYWIYKLYSTDKITDEEYNKIRDYIKSNRPSKFSSINAFKNRNIGFYWIKRNIKPRIKWIEKHIKL